ncbi:NmrA family NAD(P)-binding protein [Streptomyces sp. NPDC057245]|uniref:NmrA family NAD(P)-binding protein n=1 Tax=Streptomyces TaxID=1883 RepID=UPI001C1DEFD3|nr:NmrA family NAD(P)-binding protein [Streptomyces sp. A108]MBU6531458.1 NmrA family NAD(P)-binding protein [Streptomyces sp. A108]
MSTASAPVLVTGATGRQGGATARALLKSGVPVRALVRDPSTDRAAAVAALGAELVTGDLDDRDSLVRAAEGARAVFSVQMPDFARRGFEGEVEQATRLIEAARTAGVPQFVHTSVSGAGQHTSWVKGDWGWMEPYYTAKAGIQDRVREAGFTHWTLLKPSYVMENLLPSEAIVFPRGTEGGLVTLLKPATRLALVAVDDIGAAAAAAVAAPGRFDRVELELASDLLTMREIAEILGEHLGTTLTAPDMTKEEAVAGGMPDMGFGQSALNEHPQPALPEFARELGVPLTDFRTWAREHVPASA